jgi:hypothetical protein
MSHNVSEKSKPVTKKSDESVISGATARDSGLTNRMEVMSTNHAKLASQVNNSAGGAGRIPCAHKSNVQPQTQTKSGPHRDVACSSKVNYEKKYDSASSRLNLVDGDLADCELQQEAADAAEFAGNTSGGVRIPVGKIYRNTSEQVLRKKCTKSRVLQNKNSTTDCQDLSCSGPSNSDWDDYTSCEEQDQASDETDKRSIPHKQHDNIRAEPSGSGSVENQGRSKISSQPTFNKTKSNFGGVKGGKSDKKSLAMGKGVALLNDADEIGFISLCLVDRWSRGDINKVIRMTCNKPLGFLCDCGEYHYELPICTRSLKEQLCAWHEAAMESLGGYVDDVVEPISAPAPQQTQTIPTPIIPTVVSVDSDNNLRDIITDILLEAQPKKRYEYHSLPSFKIAQKVPINFVALGSVPKRVSHVFKVLKNQKTLKKYTNVPLTGKDLVGWTLHKTYEVPITSDLKRRVVLRDIKQKLFGLKASESTLACIDHIDTLVRPRSTIGCYNMSDVVDLSSLFHFEDINIRMTYEKFYSVDSEMPDIPGRITGTELFAEEPKMVVSLQARWYNRWIWNTEDSEVNLQTPINHKIGELSKKKDMSSRAQMLFSDDLMIGGLYLYLRRQEFEKYPDRAAKLAHMTKLATKWRDADEKNELDCAADMNRYFITIQKVVDAKDTEFLLAPVNVDHNRDRRWIWLSNLFRRQLN